MTNKEKRQIPTTAICLPHMFVKVMQTILQPAAPDITMEVYSEEQLIQNTAPFNDEKTGLPDWSTVHTSTNSLREQPSTGKGWREYELTTEQVSTFHRNGYLANVPVLSGEECEKLLSDYRKILALTNNSDEVSLLYEYHKNQSNDPDNVLMHALGHWRISQYFHDLIFHPAIVIPSSQLMAEGQEKYCRVRYWHDQLFAKPPRCGGVVAWHQDYSYWTRTTPMHHLTVHIALEDQTIENGCIHYIPGSHKWTRNGMPLPVTDFNFKDMESIKTILTEEERNEFKPTPCLLKRGEASFHHALAVHGSYQNRSDLPRRAAVVNYFADGVRSNTNELLLDGTYIIEKGNLMRGQFFPIVFDPAVLCENK